MSEKKSTKEIHASVVQPPYCLYSNPSNRGYICKEDAENPNRPTFIATMSKSRFYDVLETGLLIVHLANTHAALFEALEVASTHMLAEAERLARFDDTSKDYSDRLFAKNTVILTALNAAKNKP